MPTLGDDVIAPLLNANRPAVLRAVEHGYRLFAAGQAVEAPPSYLRFPHDPAARIIAKPAALYGDRPIAGVKWISSFPGNVAKGAPRASGALLLNDLNDGRPRACMEAAAVSAHRTAASAVMALGKMHDRNATGGGVAIVGAGPIARHVAEYLIEDGWSSGRWFIADLDPARADALAAEIATAEIAAAETAAPSIDSRIAAAAACRAADIVVFATSAAAPFLDGADLFRPDQTVLHLSLRDLGAQTIAAGANYTDDPDVAFTNATSLQLAETATGGRGFLQGGIGAVLDMAPERRVAGKTAIFSPFGLAALDLAVADWIERAVVKPLRL